MNRETPSSKFQDPAKLKTTADRSRRLALSLLTSATALVLAGCGPQPPASDSASTDAADFPSKTISVICPWSPGGGTDRMARFMADQLQSRLGKPVVVVNKTGGSGAIGHSEGARATPDGHTITMATFELSTMHWMGISELTWEDFQPLYLLNGDAAAFFVRKDSEIKSLEDLLARIKASPGQITMSGTASGGAWDLARAGFFLKAGLPVDSVIWSPTQGSAPAIVELLGGHIDVVCCSLPEAATQLESGQLRALAVMAPERVAGFADVPTVKELGIDWEAVGWRGLCLPKGTPEPIVGKLAAECRAIVEGEDYRTFMEKNRFAIQAGSPADFGEFMRRQDAQWKTVIEAAGFARNQP
ncbi:MAG TPA: tripartite tricarboxylate transporter substrate binding protein [Verrucomicrobiales bacterium]|nr:tripartite tricarboxylate transporter substrate binding protein [Verrucomicrobiales bacterium]